MNRTILALCLFPTLALAGPYPGTGPYPIAGAPTPYSTTNWVLANTAATLISSVNGAAASTTVYIAPGQYNLGTNILVIPDNVNLIGGGHDKVNIIGYADCSAHENGFGPTGGPQIHPGNNSYLYGFTVTCDTNTMVGLVPTTHSGTWAAIGCSYLNPPTTTPFTNVLVKDVWAFEGYFDAFHVNASNFCDIRFEDCRADVEGGVLNFVSALPERTNSIRLERVVGNSAGKFPNAIVLAFSPSSYFLSYDSQVSLIDCSANIATNTSSGVFVPWSLSTSNLALVSGGYFYSQSTTDAAWNGNAVYGNFTWGTKGIYGTNVFKPWPYNFPISVAGSGGSFFSNTVTITAGGTKITGLETNVNAICYNTNAFTSGNSMDVTLPVQFISAGAVTVAGFLNVEYNHWYTPVLMVSNNSAAAFSVVLPNGTAILTNAVTTANSIPAGKRARFSFDVYPHSTSGFTNVVIMVQSN